MSVEIEIVEPQGFSFPNAASSVVKFSESTFFVVPLGICPVFVGKVDGVDHALVGNLLSQAHGHVVDVIAPLGIQLRNDVVVDWLLFDD